MTTYDAPRTDRVTPARTAAGWLLAALSPLLAWVGWISWSAYASDAQHVAWFATVAVGVLVAGVVARPRGALLAGISVTAWLASLATLSWWWGSEDETGLFVVGIVLAAPLLAGAAPALLLLGRVVGAVGRRP